MSARSKQPIFWLLFGAGGMLSALIGWMLVFIEMRSGTRDGWRGIVPSRSSCWKQSACPRTF